MSCMMMNNLVVSMYFFFFNDTATTEIYTLSLHDALPICRTGMKFLEGAPVFAVEVRSEGDYGPAAEQAMAEKRADYLDRKSTRLNSSHANISYAVFCLKKKTSYIVLSLTRIHF